MTKTVPLSTAIKTHDGETRELTLRALKASDIVAMREAPFKVLRLASGDVELEVRYDKMMEYLSRLCGIDDLILGDLSAADFQTACSAVGDIWNGVGE